MNATILNEVAQLRKLFDMPNAADVCGLPSCLFTVDIAFVSERHTVQVIMSRPSYRVPGGGVGASNYTTNNNSVFPAVWAPPKIQALPAGFSSSSSSPMLSNLPFPTQQPQHSVVITRLEAVVPEKYPCEALRWQLQWPTVVGEISFRPHVVAELGRHASTNPSHSFTTSLWGYVRWWAALGIDASNTVALAPGTSSSSMSSPNGGASGGQIEPLEMPPPVVSSSGAHGSSSPLSSSSELGKGSGSLRGGMLYPSVVSKQQSGGGRFCALFLPDGQIAVVKDGALQLHIRRQQQQQQGSGNSTDAEYVTQHNEQGRGGDERRDMSRVPAVSPLSSSPHAPPPRRISTHDDLSRMAEDEEEEEEHGKHQMVGNSKESLVSHRPPPLAPFHSALPTMIIKPPIGQQCQSLVLIGNGGLRGALQRYEQFNMHVYQMQQLSNGMLRGVGAAVSSSSNSSQQQLAFIAQQQQQQSHGRAASVPSSSSWWWSQWGRANSSSQLYLFEHVLGNPPPSPTNVAVSSSTSLGSPSLLLVRDVVLCDASPAAALEKNAELIDHLVGLMKGAIDGTSQPIAATSISSCVSSLQSLSGIFRSVAAMTRAMVMVPSSSSTCSSDKSGAGEERKGGKCRHDESNDDDDDDDALSISWTFVFSALVPMLMNALQLLDGLGEPFWSGVMMCNIILPILLHRSPAATSSSSSSSHHHRHHHNNNNNDQQDLHDEKYHPSMGEVVFSCAPPSIYRSLSFALHMFEMVGGPIQIRECQIVMNMCEHQFGVASPPSGSEWCGRAAATAAAAVTPLLTAISMPSLVSSVTVHPRVGSVSDSVAGRRSAASRVSDSSATTTTLASSSADTAGFAQHMPLKQCSVCKVALMRTQAQLWVVPPPPPRTVSTATTVTAGGGVGADFAASSFPKYPIPTSNNNHSAAPVAATSTTDSQRGEMVLQCRKCGHGGHYHHMLEWWNTWDVSCCPEGCDCVCFY